MINKFILFCLTIIVLFFFFSPNTIAATNNKLNIATSPEKVLFDLTNLKPGDWMERTLIIENKGEEDFNYLFSSKLKEGSEKFFNELTISVSYKEQVLFDGKMKDFSKLDPRFIAKNKSEKLFFKIAVPGELGNDFQGLYSKVEFKFYVEGTLGGVLPADGPKLPVTGTNMFNLIVIGIGVVLFGSTLQFIFARRRKLID